APLLHEALGLQPGCRIPQARLRAARTTVLLSERLFPIVANAGPPDSPHFGEDASDVMVFLPAHRGSTSIVQVWPSGQPTDDRVERQRVQPAVGTAEVAGGQEPRRSRSVRIGARPGRGLR